MLARITWNRMPWWRRGLLLACVTFFAVSFGWTWPHAPNANLYRYIAWMGQLLAMSTLLLIVFFAPGRSHFFTWPLWSRWAFALGFCMQIVALALLSIR